MRTAKALCALSLSLLLAACGSSSTSTSPSGPAESSPAASSPAASVVLEPTAGLTCDDLAEVGTTLTTKVHYVALNVGTANDSSSYYPDVNQAMTDLGALAEECTPKAVEPVAALAASVAALEEGMQPGTDQAVIDADAALLATVRADGIAAYTALKLPTVGWENAPEQALAS